MISPSGVLSRCSGSGEIEGAGVGRGGGISGTTEVCWTPLTGRVLFRFRGDALFVGDAGSLGTMLWSGSKICDGSIPSPVFALRPRAFFWGDTSTFAVVCLRVVFLGLRLGAGAGMKSSSTSWAIRLSSSSDSSTTTFFRAARLVGRVGETVAIVSVGNIGTENDFLNYQCALTTVVIYLDRERRQIELTRVQRSLC